MYLCKGKAAYYIKDYYSTVLSRDEVYKGCSAYSAGVILVAGIRMFDTDRVKWNRAYGGEKWKQIYKTRK